MGNNSDQIVVIFEMIAGMQLYKMASAALLFTVLLKTCYITSTFILGSKCGKKVQKEIQMQIREVLGSS